MKLFHVVVAIAILSIPIATIKYIYTEKYMLSSEDVRNRLADELNIGDSASDIESFFERHGIEFGWNEFGHVYEGIIRDVGPFHSITLKIYVDDRRRYVKSEVNDSYIAP